MNELGAGIAGGGGGTIFMCNSVTHVGRMNDPFVHKRPLCPVESL